MQTPTGHTAADGDGVSQTQNDGKDTKDAISPALSRKGAGQVGLGAADERWEDV